MAIQDAQAVLQYDPRQLTAWYRFGISLITAKMPAEAIDVLETALTLDPKWAPCLSPLLFTKLAAVMRGVMMFVL